MSDATADHPAHLDPSELGTVEYWNNYYQNDLDRDGGGADGDRDDDDDGPSADPADLESWFDDVNAPAKVLEFLTSDDFPLSPGNSVRGEEPTVLDLGTGNGSMLLTLRMEGGYRGSMVGVDYSQQSVDLARRLWKQYSSRELDGGSHGDIEFERVDVIREDPATAPWWPDGGFDLVLDKGTFDAISLSSETVADGVGGPRRICEVYPSKVVEMMASGGYLLITSCNWTEDEVVRWFTHGDGVEGRLEVFGRIKYPVYEFGGHQGQGVASVCFKKMSVDN